jgi:peptidoglycan/LPS O-acetylase OafA/YrhL
MGLFRFLFAASVIAVHSGPIFGSYLVGGIIAVETFFMISGFYMSLILTDKYKYGAKTYMLFITNRLLRLYPAYIIVALATLGLSLFWASHGLDNRLIAYFQYFGLMDIFTKIYILFINAFIFGQDTIMFLGLNTQNGSLFFTPHYAETIPQIWVMLLVPQAWTLGLELAFYLIAPFLIKLRTHWIIVLLLASFGLRLLLSWLGFDPNPWSLRFFPTEFFFFLLGCLAHRIYISIKTKKFNKQPLIGLYASFFLVSLFFLFLPTITIGWFDIRVWVYYLLFFAFMPYIFLLTKNASWDRNLGKLSYPMYISHSIIVFAMMVHNIGHFRQNNFFGLTALIITVFISALLVFLVEDPINKYRQRRVLAIKKKR